MCVWKKNPKFYSKKKKQPLGEDKGKRARETVVFVPFLAQSS